MSIRIDGTKDAVHVLYRSDFRDPCMWDYFLMVQRCQMVFSMKRNYLKLLGEISGITGAFLVATNTAISGYGFLFFCGSSMAWSYIAFRSREWSLFRMSLAFTFVNVLGILRWLG